MKKKNLRKIAMACHAAHNIHCANNDMQVIAWEDKSKEHHKIVMNSVKKILDGKIKSPEKAHMNFVKKKKKDGWMYDAEYSTERKTNPRLCDFDELPSNERMKEEFFFAVASSFKKKA